MDREFFPCLVVLLETALFARLLRGFGSRIVKTWQLLSIVFLKICTDFLHTLLSLLRFFFSKKFFSHFLSTIISFFSLCSVLCVSFLPFPLLPPFSSSFSTLFFYFRLVQSKMIPALLMKTFNEPFARKCRRLLPSYFI